MKLIRYYRKRPVDAGHIRAVRDLLANSFRWGFASASYQLYYASECYSLEQIKEVDKVVTANGQPSQIRVSFKSQGGRTITIDTRDPGRIAIDVFNKSDLPSEVLEAIEPVLSLEPLAEIQGGRAISSAFIAHGFTDDGSKSANELARFLGLLGVRCESGRAFSPSRVSDKVNRRLAKHDMFVAIATPQEDFTWITQEIATAAALEKYVFILKEADVTLKEGILGDHEYIPFPKDQLSKTFIPILEGLNELCGRAANLCSWDESGD